MPIPIHPYMYSSSRPVIHPAIHSSICLSIHLSIHPSIYLFVRTYVHILSVHACMHAYLHTIMYVCTCVGVGRASLCSKGQRHTVDGATCQFHSAPLPPPPPSLPHSCSTVQDTAHWDILDLPPIQDPFPYPLPWGISPLPNRTVDPTTQTPMPLICLRLVVTMVTIYPHQLAPNPRSHQSWSLQ